MHNSAGYDPRMTAGQPQYDPATMQQLGYGAQQTGHPGDARAAAAATQPPVAGGQYPGYHDPNYHMHAYSSMYGYPTYPTNGYNNYPQQPPNSGNNGSGTN